ncbi:type II secretion system secretin GspD [Desulfonema ishimotonii]|uniref:type II secretion system secretin GspD n=1 Tax=Desulfonema ishimotonii TaxID=45657 RepID=UPI0014097128|nr:type II secretion system secretin GspD [Desulfonema ishimotonii]
MKQEPAAPVTPPAAMTLDHLPVSEAEDGQHRDAGDDMAVVEDARPPVQAVHAEPSREPHPQETGAADRYRSTRDTPSDLLGRVSPREGDFVMSRPRTPDAPSDGASDIVFNFDDADLLEVVRTMAELLRINYILDTNARGKVTIHTAGNLRKQDLFPVFYQVLEANGLTAVKEGSLYKIISLKDASRMPILSRYGRTAANVPPEERVVMQIIPLKHIAAQEMTKLLSPFISAEGTIISHADSNTLLVVDKGINIVKALRLADAFDIDLFRKMSHRFYTVGHGDAEEILKLLREILAAYGKDDKSDVKLIAVSRLNAILAISADPGVFEKIGMFIRRLDVPPGDSADPRIYVYPVRNGEAEELGSLLNTVFTGESAEDKKTASPKVAAEPGKNPYTPPNPFESEKKKKTDKKETAAASRSAEGASTLKGDVRITPDTTRNALIIEATPADYRIVEGILRQIDIMPRQVLIEVIIAEITLDGKNQLGVEWLYEKGTGGSLSTSLLSGQMGSAGLQFAIGQTDRWSMSLSALATENKANILSAPLVLASDNKEASINVSTQVPVASAEYLYDSGSSGVTQTNIQYRDTGIILSVTPHINDRGLVNMEISQEVSEEGGGVEVGGQSYPSFRERKVSTTLTVRHGQTIVMGGLMSKTSNNSDSGVPILSKIPGIGFLFGKDSDDFSKTDLVLLITPRVIVNLNDIDAVTEEFRSKVDHISQKVN